MNIPSNKRYCAVAAGRTFTDIIAHVAHDFLDKYDIPLDAGKPFDAEEIGHMRSQLDAPIIMAGGTAANAMAIIAALGGRVGFFGKVGRDDLGDFFLKDFQQRGVEMCCDPYSNKGGVSATCLVLLTEDGHRSFATHFGCADSYVSDDFSNFDFSSTDFFMIDAELLVISTAAKILRETITRAKNKTRIVVSLHNVYSFTEHKDAACFIAEMADLVIGNEAEQASFAQAVRLPYSPEQIVVTTMGAKGAKAITKHSFVSVPGQVPPVFISSVGAGDAFNAGLLFGLARGFDIEQSMQTGVRAALAIIGEIGARPALPLNDIWKGI